MQLKRVVFPAPLGPMIEKISPLWTSKLISLRASSPPKEIERLQTSKKIVRFFVSKSALSAADQTNKSGWGHLIAPSLASFFPCFLIRLHPACQALCLSALFALNQKELLLSLPAVRIVGIKWSVIYTPKNAFEISDPLHFLYKAFPC